MMLVMGKQCSGYETRAEATSGALYNMPGQNRSFDRPQHERTAKWGQGNWASV
jgi:hypothetical protein